ncbi:exonuclease V [Mycena albidolilacea]|uniref:Exonuclease V n=1 Tax=Mycena albidolilacea TaxID=1033008 RepID=A0AAD7F261_9AGAR|nr:exonuclease V [Mycena albidolilacea]
MSDDSEYEAYNDFADLTEEDFARLDAAISASDAVAGLPTLGHIDDSAMPSISIELEGSCDSEEQGSPINRYRRAGSLSVTDLISLAWCEVQFDYGMRQKRFRNLTDRPASFRTESGKEIVVEQEVAARNDKTTKRGQFIHKELELELQPEEITVLVTTEEERWAFRLINFLASMAALGVERCVREIPVFGVVDGVVVIGIIDELLIRNRSEPETGTKRPSDSALPPQKRACRSPSCEPKPLLAPTPSRRCIRLIDTKTRRSFSLPSDEDAEPARLQVMLYHRLLIRLLDSATLFDFAAFWPLVGVDSTATFSEVFLLQTAQLLGGTESPLKCLDDVVVLLRRKLAALDLPPVDDTLEIIYRSQNKYSRGREKRKGREKTPATSEDDELTKAIAMSLEDVFEGQLAAALRESAAFAAADIQAGSSNLDQTDVQGHGGLGLSLVAGGSTRTPGPGPQNGGSSTAGVWGREPTLAVVDLAADSSPPPETGTARPEIIGTKEFTMDDAVLETYLNNALDWWRGKRSARGVSDRQTGRCFSCEYREDCEWREQKASEKLEEARQRRAPKLKGAPAS